MDHRRVISAIAVAGAVAAGAATAAGLVALARGETTGAPGITKAFARLGRSLGQSMVTGVALTGAAASAVGVAFYAGVRQMMR